MGCTAVQQLSKLHRAVSAEFQCPQETSVDFKLWATDIVGQNVTAGKPVVLSMLLRRHALHVQLAQLSLTD